MAPARRASFDAILAAVTGLVLFSASERLGARTVLFLLVTLLLATVASQKPDCSIPIVVATVMFSALARRVFPAPNPVVDPASLFPYIVAAPLALRGARHRSPPSIVFFLVWASLTAVLRLGSPLVGLAGILNLAVPILVALGIASQPGGGNSMRRSVTICGGIASTYAFIQFIHPFAWDRHWLSSVRFLSVGRPGSSSFRPFGTLPSPGAMAVVAAVVVILALLPGGPVHGFTRLWAGTSCGTVLLLSQVRSVWIAVAAAILVSVIGNRAHAGRVIAGIGLLAFGTILLVPSKTALLDRAGTLSDPKGDQSFSLRARLLGQVGDLTTPLGRGIGQLSAGNRLEGGTSTDNGYLVVLGETGVIGFAFFIWVLATTTKRSTPAEYPFVMMLVIANAAGFAIGGIGGIVLWAATGLQRADPGTAAPGVPVGPADRAGAQPGTQS